MYARKRILFVDDEPNVLQGLQRMLRPMRDEWEMVFAQSGAQALELMATVPFEVVVSDMRMPVMDGAQLLREVLNRHPATVRLILSGHADRDLVAQCVGVAHQYINKPCDPDQLKTMIRNATLLGGTLVSDDVKRIIGSIDHLPTIPQVYSDLREALALEDIAPRQIGEIIQQDIAMTAKILKLVNSAFFGLRRIIEAPAEAVAYLGVETIKVLVLANGIFDQTQTLKTRCLSLDDLWHHSLRVAHGAKAIAQLETSDKAIIDEAFVGGLLHDVGILALASNFPEAYDRLTQVVLSESISIPTAELEEFGVTHAEVGAYMLGLWGIPAPVLGIISLHHRPAVSADLHFTPLLAVHAADVMVGPLGSSIFEPTKLDSEALALAGLSDRMGAWHAAVLNAREGGIHDR